MLMLLAISIPSAWAAEATIEFSKLGLENGVQYLDPFIMDDNVSITFAGGGNDGKYYTTGSGIRTYGGGTITIDAGNGTITTATFVFSGASYAPTTDNNVPNTGTLTMNSGSGSWSGETSSLILTRPSGTGHWRLQKVSVTYTPGDSGEGQGGESGTSGDGTVNFGSAQGSINVNSASVSGDDNLGNTWNVTTEGTTSYTPNQGYAQIGSGSKPATSITFTTTLETAMTVSAFSAKFGGFSGTAGTVTLKVGNTTVGTGSLNVNNDVIVNATNTTTSGSTLTVTITDISKGVKAYYISYTVAESGGATKQDANFEYDEADKNNLVKVGTSFTAPTLSTADGFDGTVVYSSSDDNVVAVNASSGALTINATGKAVVTASSEATDAYNAGSASYTIYVAEQAGTAEDPLTEASAKALIDLGGTLNAHVAGTILTPTYYSSSNTYTVTLTDGFQFYKLKDLGNELFTSDYLKVHDQLVVFGPLSKHNSTYQLGDGCYIVSYEEYTEPLVDISNTKETAYTVARALELAVDPTSDLSKAVYITGVVYDVKSFNAENGTLDIYIKDESVDNKFEFFRCAGIYNTSLTAFTAANDVQVGDEVIGYGVMKYYSSASIWEFDNTKEGDYLVELNRPEVQTYSITYEENGGAEVADVAEATNLPDPLPSTTKDGKAFGGWFADAEFNTPAVAGAALTSNVTLYAKWNDVSAWASVYTSKVTLSTEGGTNASGAKVKLTSNGTEYDALKAGTSSKVGAVVVTVPDGATKLHFHAYGWNGENVTLGVTAPTGVIVSPASVNIAANTGVTSNSPFTLAEGSDPKTDAYYAVTLSGNTGETALTFTATSGKRFVLFGVNQEGGAIPASIAANPTSLAFGSVEQDANVEAKTINVTLTEVAAATVTLAGDGASAFSIDKEALNASGIITVTPNTTNVGTYAATITISDNASEAESVEVAVSMTITEPMAVDDLSGTWTLVTEASQLVAGKKVIIASVPEEGSAITMSTRQATNNRPGVSGATIAENAITAQSGTAVFTLEAGTQENTIAFKSSANEYLCAASSSKNYLHSQTEKDNNGSWTISIAEGVATITAQGDYTRNVMRYNPNNDSPIFACYASTSETGTLITLYVQESEPEPELNYVEARTGLTIGKFYTICMPRNIRGVRGATFWNLNNRNEDGSMVYFVEAGASLDAGKPYIFIATAETLEVAYGEENAGSPVANGALRGTFSAMTQGDFNDVSTANGDSPIYMLVNNQLRQVAGRTGNSLGANRAYVIYNELQAGEPTPAPGRRVLAMPMNENVATGIDALGSDAQPSKIIVNGQLFIIRDGKAYDATGRQVSKF